MHRAMVKADELCDLQGLAFGDLILLPEKVQHRFYQVLRLEKGAVVEILNGQGLLIQGELKGEHLKIIFQKEQQQSVYAPTVIQSWTKAKKLEDVVRRSCELGATKLLFYIAERTQGRPKKAQLEKVMQRLKTVAEEAARQSLRDFVPILEMPMTLSELQAWLLETEVTLMLGTLTAEQTLSATLQEFSEDGDVDWQKIAFLVGPEGGLSTTEINIFKEKGAIEISLGRHVLRTETAALVALSAWQVCTGHL